jgi:molybdate transport system substrate-binding protein
MAAGLGRGLVSRRGALTLALGGLATGASETGARAADGVLVFAAMTLKDALDQVVARYRARGGGPVTLSYGPTGTLVQQIANGAAADIFFSADSDWMDYAASHELIQPGSRRDVLTSQLVLIAAVDSTLPVDTVTSATPLAQWLGTERLAVCDPKMMPAGRFARASLEKLGLWSQVQDRIAMADTVRAAVIDVARHEVPLAIVFDTDAALDHSVKVLGTFAADTHPPIVYPAALTKNAKSDAVGLLRYFEGPEAGRLFEHFGYRVA